MHFVTRMHVSIFALIRTMPSGFEALFSEAQPDLYRKLKSAGQGLLPQCNGMHYLIVIHHTHTHTHTHTLSLSENR